MRSFWGTRADSHYATGFHPALSNFVDECYATLSRLTAYVGALALVAILAVHFWDDSRPGSGEMPQVKADWSVATRSYPAFAVSQMDSSGETATYQILRHPEGGRKDILRWAANGKGADRSEKLVAELQIYRPGGESIGSESLATDLADRMDRGSGRNIEAAGVIDSKFGTVTLLRLTGRPDDASPCLGFVKRLDDPTLRISGWSCRGDSWPARRAAVGCLLNRLILLTAGNEPKLAELFARAELRRGSCAPDATSANQADWVTGAQNPGLRGAL